MGAIAIAVANRQRTLRISVRRLRAVLRWACAAEGVTAGEFSIAVIDAVAMHALNQAYLKHDYPTDVLTFPLSPPGEPLHGEIVVSADFAREHAAEIGTDPLDELDLYVVHGFLHLVGYDDATPARRRRMKARQEAILAQFREPADSSPSRRPSPKQGKGSHAPPKAPLPKGATPNGARPRRTKP